MSLVSLVVLGIFGRNTGFGPSMSLNNIIDHKRDVYVQKKRNVCAWNFHKMYEYIVLKSVLSIFICPTLVLGAWWNRGVESWGDQCSRKRDQEAPQCHLQKTPFQMVTISFKKRHIRWLQSLPHLHLQLPLVCHLCLRWLVGAGEYFISEDIFVQIYQYFGNIGEIV